MSGDWSSLSLPEPVRAAYASLRMNAESGQLAHGYVIAAPNPAWGMLLAKLLLQQLFCEADASQRPCGECRGCRQIETQRHPDTVWLEPEMKSRVIGIEAIREANHFLRQTAFEGGWKSAVFMHADRMNEAAANAFLKTLEEPPPQVLLLLITESPQALLPTIISRCRMVSLAGGGAAQESSAVEKAMLDWLRRREPGVSAMEQSAWISALLREVRDRAEAQEGETDDEEDVEKDVIKARVQSKVVAARVEVLRTIARWERDVLACLVGGGADTLFFPFEEKILASQSRGVDLARQLRRIERVEQARILLERNAPEQAVWEAILPA